MGGMIEATKEMHTISNKLTALDGSVVQVASSDFVPNADGKLVARGSANFSMKMDVAKVPIDLHNNVSDSHLPNIQNAKLMNPNGTASVFLVVETAMKKANGK
jgi:hypothetical protein